jgi:chromosome segregation ATPase
MEISPMPDIVSPAEKLAQLKRDLERKQNDSSRLAKEIDQLKTRSADLSKTVVDIDQKTSAYEKAAGAAGDQLKTLTAYVETEKTMLKAALEPGSITDIEGSKNAALEKLADLSRLRPKVDDQSDWTRMIWTMSDADLQVFLKNSTRQARTTKSISYDSQAKRLVEGKVIRV